MLPDRRRMLLSMEDAEEEEEEEEEKAADLRYNMSKHSDDTEPHLRPGVRPRVPVIRHPLQRLCLLLHRPEVRDLGPGTYYAPRHWITSN